VAADPLYTRKLLDAGKAVSHFEFATGRLALFTPLPVESGSITEVLRKARRIAVASPRHAPYGRSAVSFLKRIGLYEELKERLVYGANAAQALQFAASGGADAALVPLSLALHYGKGQLRRIPEELYPPIHHSIALTQRGKEKEASRSFLRFLRSREARELVKKHGFGVP